MQPSPSPSPTHNIISFLIYTNAMDNIHLSVLRDPPVGCVAMCAYPPESTFELSVLPIVCVVDVCVCGNVCRLICRNSVDFIVLCERDGRARLMLVS